MNGKKRDWILLFVLLPALMVGCAGPSDSKVVLKAWDWWSPASSPALKQYFQEVEQEFEALHPKADLRYQFIPFGESYCQKLITGLSSSDPPDCFQSSIIWARDLYDRGALLSLNERIEAAPELAPGQFFEQVLPYCQKNGTFYGIPMAMDANVLLYNLDLFEAAGLDASPDSLRSWDDFVVAARRLTRRDAASGEILQAGYLVDSAGTFFTGLLPWLYANGGSFYSEDESSAAFHHPSARETLQFFVDLLYTHQVSLPLAANRQDFQLFVQGKAAMMMGGTWSGYMLSGVSPNLRFGMTSFPPGPSGRGRATCTWGNMYVIPKKARHPDLAWEFIKFYCGPRNAARMLRLLQRNSPRKDFYETPEWKAAVERFPYLAEVPKICAVGGPYPMTRFNEVNDVFRPLFQGVLLRSRGPEEALGLAEEGVNQILKMH